MRGQIRGDAIRPGNVCGRVVVGLPGRHDFDHAVRRADAKGVAAEGNPSRSAVEVVHGNGRVLRCLTLAGLEQCCDHFWHKAAHISGAHSVMASGDDMRIELA